MLCALFEALFIVTIIVQIIEIIAVHNFAILMINIFSECLINIIFVEWSVRITAVYDSAI